jgi:type IV fimbrial biogenesis protein FimT
MIRDDHQARERAMRRTQGYRRARRERGITVIEQLMVVTIVAVLASLAAPPLRSLLVSSRLQTAQLDFIGALRYARYAAAIGNTRTIFCPTHDGAHCSGQTQWSEGWLLGKDRNHDNQPDGMPLRVGTGYAQLDIHSSAGRRQVSFHPDGTAGGSNLTLLLCSPDGRHAPLSIVVSNAGRVRGASATATQATTCPHAG